MLAGSPIIDLSQNWNSCSVGRMAPKRSVGVAMETSFEQFITQKSGFRRLIVKNPAITPAGLKSLSAPKTV
jgi:hypothetical protein